MSLLSCCRCLSPRLLVGPSIDLVEEGFSFPSFLWGTWSTWRRGRRSTGTDLLKTATAATADSCQTSKDKGSANNNYDDASSFQITVLVHKTTFLICTFSLVFLSNGVVRFTVSHLKLTPIAVCFSIGSTDR